MKQILLIFLIIMLFANSLQADDRIRVGALKFGTVNWELNVIQHHGLDREQNINLEVIPFSGNQAAKIALHGKQADIIVADWVWVSRERHKGEDFSFIPYSAALGALMVPPASQAKTPADLKKMRVGVAGGSYDKSWLMLRAWTRQHHGFDPADTFDVRYAAPPLLNGQIEQNHLDAVLNFWHYCARLEAQGYRRLVEMNTIGKTFTGSHTLPMIGYVFRDAWAHDQIVERFNNALRKARDILLTDDAEWRRLRPLMKVPDQTTFYALRDRYRAGIPQRWGTAERHSASRLLQTLITIAGKKLTDGHDTIAEGTFWDTVRF